MKITGINLKTRHWALIAVCVVLSIAAVSAYLRSSAVLAPGADAFLVDHLSDRPYVSKILCPDRIDANDYSARPVSHFFENIDAHIFYLSYLVGKPVFVSICTKILLVIISAAMWFFMIKHAGVHPGLATLVLAFFWLNPNVFFASALFRDSKIAATFFLTLAILYSFRFISQELPSRLRNSAVIFFLALLACHSDLQGFTFVLILSGISLVWAFFTKSRNAYLTFASGMGASLVYMVLATFILPGLVAKYAGIHTNHDSIFTFVNHLQADTAENHFGRNLKTGLFMYLDTIRLIFCNIPRIAIAAGIIILLIAIFKFARHRFLIAFCFILFIAGNCIMESAIFTRLNGMQYPEAIISGYYQLSTTVLFFIALLLIVPPLVKSFNIPRSVSAALLAMVICANIIVLPHHIKTATELRNISSFKGYIVSTPAIREELIALSKVKPVGPPLPNNAWGENHSYTYCINSDKMLQTIGKIDTKYYIAASRIINFLRSKKGLPYYKIRIEEPEEKNDQNILRHY